MKAAIIRQFGGPDVLKVEDIPTPVAGPGQVQVKVLGALVNRLDHYIRKGDITDQLVFPHVLGLDAVGEISALGEGVSKFKVGERVITMAGYPTDPKEYGVRPTTIAPSYSMRGLQLQGSYAQYITIPQEFVLSDTTGLPIEQVAALPVPFLTGLMAVQVTGEVKAGQFVLVHAGASATGLMSIQIAKALGAKVATTVRTRESADMAKSAGADLVINTSEENFNEAISKWTDGVGVDVVVDSLGGPTFERSIEALKTKGILVAMGFMSGSEVKFDIRKFFFGLKQIRGSLSADMEYFVEWMDRIRDGKIKPLIDCVLPLEEAAKAHVLVGSNKAKGAVILLPWD